MLDVTLEDPGMRRHVFPCMQSIENIARLCGGVNNDADVQDIATIVSVVCVVIEEDVVKVFSQFVLSA